MSRIANFTRSLAAKVINLHAAALVRVAHKADAAEQRAWRDYDDAVELSRIMNERKRATRAKAEGASTHTDNVHYAVNVELASLPFLQGSDKL